MSATRIAVSGATGLVGSRLLPSLRQHGHELLRLVRHRTDRLDEVYWNPETGEIDARRLEGLDVVVHLAGKPLDGERWTPEVKQAVYASRVTGTALISGTLARLGVRPNLLVAASATDYYAFSSSPTSEADGQPGSGFVSEMCQAWEGATVAAGEAGIRVVNIRIPSVLAAAGHSVLAAFLPAFRVGLGFTLGSGKQLMCFIALDDMVRAIEHIFDHRELAGPVNVLAPEPVTNAEFARTLAEVLRRPRFLRVPRWVLRLAMGEVADAICEGDANLRPAKLTATGFQFLYPDISSALRHELSREARPLG
jgi:uncharacterized protein (TIGR01777 family)